MQIEVEVRVILPDATIEIRKTPHIGDNPIFIAEEVAVQIEAGGEEVNQLLEERYGTRKR